MRKRQRPQRLLLGLVFMTGLILGWVVIGWWLVPVDRLPANPWDLNPQSQRLFVRLVAEQYMQTGNAVIARQSLAGWQPQALDRLLQAMDGEASTPQAHQSLAALRQALSMPEGEESWMDSLLAQKPIVIGLGVSALPLVAALVLAVVPTRRRRALDEESLEEQAMQDDPLMQPDQAAVEQSLPAQAGTAVEQPLSTQAGNTAEPSAAQGQAQTAVQPVAVRQPPAAQPGPPQTQPVQAQGQSQPPRPDQTGIPLPATQPPPDPPGAQPAVAARPQGPQPVAAPAQPAPPQSLLPNPEESEASTIQNILASVFDDDDQSNHLATLLKGLPDVEIMDLLEQSDKVLVLLRQANKSSVGRIAVREGEAAL